MAEWVGLAVALASAAVSQQQAAKARARKKRADAMAGQQAGADGGAAAYGWNATAKKADDGEMGIGEAIQKATTPEGEASQQQQGMSLGAKSEPAPEAQPFTGAFHDTDATQPNRMSELEQPAAQPKSSGADTAGQIGGYSQLALQLYDAYAKSKEGPPAGQIPQLGPMNTAPTAKKFYR